MKTNKLFLSIVLSMTIVLLSPLQMVLASETALDSQDKQRFINETNEQRSSLALARLNLEPSLMTAAQMKAEHMAANSYFAHTSPDGVTPWHWFYEAGYRPRVAGENLALSYSLDSDIFDAWMNSEGHKKNIVSENYKEIGIGIAQGMYNGREVYYIVQLFGNPAN